MAADLKDFAPRTSVQEYLDTEPLSEVKREYLDGVVVAMAGEEWELTCCTAGSVRLDCLDAELALAEVYADVLELAASMALAAEKSTSA